MRTAPGKRGDKERKLSPDQAQESRDGGDRWRGLKALIGRGQAASTSPGSELQREKWGFQQSCLGVDVVPGGARPPRAGAKKGTSSSKAKVCCQGCALRQGDSARTRPVCAGPLSLCLSVPLSPPRRGTARSPRGGSRRTPNPARHPGTSGLGTARETLGINNTRPGKARVPHGRAPGSR